MTAFCIINDRQLDSYVSTVEKMAGMVAALAHDMNHKGVNNLFHSKKVSRKCLVYSGVSILENMHSSQFFRLMQEKQLNPLFQAIGQEINRFKEVLVASILSTDMTSHNLIFQQFSQMVRASRLKQNTSMLDEVRMFVEDQALDLTNPIKRNLCINTLVHAADIGGPALEYERYINWSILVVQEFHEQTIKEEQLGLEVTAMFQYKGELGFYGGQVFFTTTFTMPLWKIIGSFFTDLQFLGENCEQNIKKLQNKIQELKAA